MTLGSDQELENTKRKLKLLERSLDESRADDDGGDHLREIEMESLTRLINQLKEEIARYEAHQPSRP